MTKTQAIQIAGSLGQPSKMPAYSYGLPTAACITGAKLAAVKGSVCFGCYANKGLYSMFAKTIIPAQQKRLESIADPLWVTAMVTLIGKSTKTPFFRWHDSGDIQSVEHLQKIAEIADKLPRVRFWLPTREYRIVREFLKTRAVPKNLVIRISAHMVDQSAPGIAGLPVSTVFSEEAPKGAWECPARYQDNKCGDCRVCWDLKVKHVSYHQH